MRLVAPQNMQLRHVSDDDHDFLVELHNDPVVLANLTNPTPISLKSHMSWWESIKHDPRELRLIFTVDDARVGFTKFYAIDHVNKNCILGADIHKSFRGFGYAKYMWSLMLEQSFRTMGLHRVSLTTASYNEIGHRVYTNLGFMIEGIEHDALLRDGKYHDCIVMYMLEDSWR